MMWPTPWTQLLCHHLQAELCELETLAVLRESVLRSFGEMGFE